MNVGIKLFIKSLALSLENIIPEVFADSEDHINFMCFKWWIFEYLRAKM